MLRYDRQTKPGLVALYDIRPGNGAGLFLQPRSQHGAAVTIITVSTCWTEPRRDGQAELAWVAGHTARWFTCLKVVGQSH